MPERRGRSRAWRTSDGNSSFWHCETYVTEDTTNTMGCEDIEGIVESKGELELGRKVANSAGQETEEDGGGCKGAGLQMRDHIVGTLGVTYESQRNQKLG